MPNEIITSAEFIQAIIDTEAKECIKVGIEPGSILPQLLQYYGLGEVIVVKDSNE